MFHGKVTRKSALTLLLTAVFLTACGSQKIVTVPEVVEVVRYERLPIPANLLTSCEISPVPDVLTYGEALSLWAEDRRCGSILGGQIEAIGVLNDVDTDSSQ